MKTGDGDGELLFGADADAPTIDEERMYTNCNYELNISLFTPVAIWLSDWYSYCIYLLDQAMNDEPKTILLVRFFACSLHFLHFQFPFNILLCALLLHIDSMDVRCWQLLYSTCKCK